MIPTPVSAREGSLPPGPQFADGPYDVLPGPSDAVDGDHHQGVAAGKAGVELVPSLAALSTSGAGDADVAVDAVQGHAGPTELQLLGGGVHPRDPLLEPAAGADVTENRGHAGNIRLWNNARLIPIEPPVLVRVSAHLGPLPQAGGALP